MACTSAKLYWVARFLLSYMPSNGRPLKEDLGIFVDSLGQTTDFSRRISGCMDKI
jgi:hypothetical protein